MNDSLLWTPSPEKIAATNMAAFMRRAGFDSYEAPLAVVDRPARGVLAFDLGFLRGGWRTWRHRTRAR